MRESEMGNGLRFLHRTCHVASLVTLIGCASLPTQEQKRQPNAEDKQTQTSSQSTSRTVTPATAATEQDRSREPANPWIEWLRSSGPADWALVVVSVLGAAFAVRTLRALEKQVTANIDAAESAKQQVSIATSPRVYVEGVHAVNFERGLEPVFFLNIANSGPVPAERIKVFVEIDHINGSTKPAQANTITVPANGVRAYDFRGSFVLPDNLAELEKWNLRVTGNVSFADSEIPFCFKYSHWFGERPASVPLFVPCDFDQRRNVAVKLQPATLYATGTVATLRVERGRSGETHQTESKENRQE